MSDARVPVVEVDGAHERGGRVRRREEGHERGAGGRLGRHAGSGRHAEGGRCARGVGGGEGELGELLLDDRHLAVGRVAVLLEGGGVDAAAPADVSIIVVDEMLLLLLRVVGRRAGPGEAGGRAEEGVGQVLSRLGGEGHVGKGHVAQRLGVGVAAAVVKDPLGAGDAVRCHRRRRRDGDIGGRRIEVLVLRADLWQQDGTMMTDGCARPGRSGGARADGVGRGLYGRHGRVDGCPRRRACVGVVVGGLPNRRGVLLVGGRHVQAEEGRIKGELHVEHRR